MLLYNKIADSILNNLSELDKVSLNILYCPVNGDNYNPEIGKTGLYYWGRKVMKRHNYPADGMADGYCGPDDGPNCPAWRTLITEKMDKLNGIGKFQGYSGMVYWGKSMENAEEGHDGVCGPDNGPPCIEWLKEVSYDETE